MKLRRTLGLAGPAIIIVGAVLAFGGLFAANYSTSNPNERTLWTNIEIAGWFLMIMGTGVVQWLSVFVAGRKPSKTCIAGFTALLVGCCIGVGGLVLIGIGLMRGQSAFYNVALFFGLGLSLLSLGVVVWSTRNKDLKASGNER